MLWKGLVLTPDEQASFSRKPSHILSPRQGIHWYDFGVLPRELIRRLRKLEITSRRAVTEGLAGRYHSVFKGRGMAFSEVRPYQPGDEIRFIDWNVSARMPEPYVKVFTEERELTVMLLIDVSESNAFGSTEQRKREVAAEIAAHLSFSAIANNDRIGMFLFSNQVEKLIPPKQGRKHVMRLMSDLMSFSPQHHGTSIASALDALASMSKRRTVTFLLSDFLDEQYEEPLKSASRRHDVVPIVISDPVEEEWPAMGLVEFQDSESGQRFLVDTSDPQVASAYVNSMKTRRQERLARFKRLALDSLEIQVGDDYAHALGQFFYQRSRHQART